MIYVCTKTVLHRPRLRVLVRLAGDLEDRPALRVLVDRRVAVLPVRGLVDAVRGLYPGTGDDDGLGEAPGLAVAHERRHMAGRLAGAAAASRL